MSSAARAASSWPRLAALDYRPAEVLRLGLGRATSDSGMAFPVVHPPRIQPLVEISPIDPDGCPLLLALHPEVRDVI